MRKLVELVLALIALSPMAARAELVNDFNCHLKKGYSVAQLYAFQQEWMVAARKQGFDEANYKTRIFFPLYAEVTDTDPMYFIWRGSFGNGAVLGHMLDWFPGSEWAGRFAQVMDCGKASLWIAPQ